METKDLDIEKLDLQPGDVVLMRFPEGITQAEFDNLHIICNQLAQRKGIIPLLLPKHVDLDKCSKKELMQLKKDVSILLNTKKFKRG